MSRRKIASASLLHFPSVILIPRVRVFPFLLQESNATGVSNETMEAMDFMTTEQDTPLAAKKPPNSNVTADEQEEEEDPSHLQSEDTVDIQQQEEDEWNAISKAIIEAGDDISQTLPRLQAFQAGTERYQKALQRLEVVFGQFQTGLEVTLTEKVLKPAVQLHGEAFEDLDAMEKHITDRFVANHACRARLLQGMANYHDTMQNQYDQVVCRILNQDYSSVEEPSHPNDKILLQDETIEHPRNDDGELVEPNWVELKEYEPSRANVETFLAARDRWNAAQDRFGAALDQLDADLKELRARLLQILVEAIDILNEELMEQQMEIRSLFADNFERRQYLENAIVKAAEHHQSMFAGLFSQVGNPVKAAMLGIGGIGRNKKNSTK